jgi:pentatricopeptide repeat protein
MIIISSGQSCKRRESFKTYNNNSDNHDHHDQQQRADHGENFVPGSEDAPNLAPQPLDHFKRGYRERTNQRDRDLQNHGNHDGGQSGNNNNINNMGNGNGVGNNNSADGGPRHDSSRYNNNKVEGNNKGGEGPMPPRFSGVVNGSYNGGGRGNGGTVNRNSSYGGGGNRGGDGDDYPRRGRGERSFGGERGRGGRGRGGGRDSGSPYRGGDSGGSGFRGGGRGGDYRRPSFHGDRDDRGGGRGGGAQIIMGLDIQALVDRLVRPGCDVFRELGVTRQSHMAVFQSGKAVTAIISNLARRRNLRIANAVWEWMDFIGIEKNTFHYNSMISACEKVRDYNKALRLLDEMKEKKVPKNEVTYVHYTASVCRFVLFGNMHDSVSYRNFFISAFSQCRRCFICFLLLIHLEH